MLSYSRYSIILAEFGIVIIFTVFAKYLPNSNWMTKLLAGTAGGAGIFLCYAHTPTLTDRIIPGQRVCGTRRTSAPTVSLHL